MMRTGWIAALLVCLFTAPALAGSAVVARISLAAQQMTVYVDGYPRYAWPVSTARRGYRTPLGSFRPIRLETMWYSRKYDNSPMPYSVFFHGGYAVHGTDVVSRLGTPASHGCVRLHPSNAAMLFGLVQQYGLGNSRIEIVR
jgi:lipoprotein-anchoring transpeptidase ErfK/SrfK